MYQITLSNAEMETLQWAAARGYFPKETLDAMTMTVESAEQERLDEEQFVGTANVHHLKDCEYTYNIPENKAWAISQQREEDSHSLYSCIGGELLKKLIKLESEIV